jgi:hypothetical protein
MIIKYIKSWVEINEDKINDLFFHSFECPMKITEMYKNIDDNGTGQSYKNLKNFLNSPFKDKDLNSIEIQVDTSETTGIILFRYEYKKNESYFYSLKKNQVEKFSKGECFKYLDDGLKEALKKDNWSETFGNRYLTMLSKHKLNLLCQSEKNLWEKRVKLNFNKEYQKFLSQPTEWNKGISKLLDLLLNDELKKLESNETLSDITFKRFDKIKFKSFICEAPDIENRLPDTRSPDYLDICVYIYALINIPENDSLDTLSRLKIDEWIKDIKFINVDAIMEFLKSFPFNYINFNFCIVTSDVVGVSCKNFDKYLYHNFKINQDLMIKDDKVVPIDTLQKKDFVKAYSNQNIEDMFSFQSSSDLYFPDLPKDFVLKCNLLVCSLISELSEKKINYDFKLVTPEIYLLDLCKDFAQYKSLVKSIKTNFGIINEVPEQHFISMKDVYYYISENII